MNFINNKKNRNEYPKSMNNEWQIRTQWRDKNPIEAENLELCIKRNNKRKINIEVDEDAEG
ncbi:MAG TPA: hypothetical protein VMV49_07600 [Candidatus Deferrimicrobium sp.]|nr:hypothetical protein [Candidatus Deferrimicrobium sp.]